MSLRLRHRKGNPGRRRVLTVGILGLLLPSWLAACSPGTTDQTISRSESSGNIALPEPSKRGDMSVEHALSVRRSVRDYRQLPVALDELSQLLWAAQGVTHASRFRTAPSAGATYPLELYAAVGNVGGLENGLYRYLVREHALERLGTGDIRAELAAAALGQSWIAKGALTLVFSALYDRTTGRYGARGEQYVHLEAGHASQNVYLQAAALGLGTVAVGAFDDRQVGAICGMGRQEVPLYIMPVGRL